MKRISYIDTAKCISILLVVLWHYASNANIEFWSKPGLLIFRMPLFAFISGLFFKDEDSVLNFLKRKANSLLIPFAFFYLLVSFSLANIVAIKNNGWSAFKPELLWSFLLEKGFWDIPLWFLWGLFLVNVLLYSICVIARHKRKYYVQIITIGIIICGTIGYSCSYLHINLLANIDSAFSLVPFFGVGFLVNRYTNFMTFTRLDKYSIVLFIGLFAITYILTDDYAFYYSNNFKVNAFVLYFCGITGIMSVIFLAKVLSRIPILPYIGRYSLVLLVIHMPLKLPLFNLVGHFNLPDYLLLTIVMSILILIDFILIPLLNKYIPQFIGQKKLFEIHSSKSKF